MIRQAIRLALVLAMAGTLAACGMFDEEEPLSGERIRVRDQIGTLGHTSTLYVTEPAVEMARRLAAIAPGRLDRSFFTNSGTEAVETAVMLACLYTGRSEIIACAIRTRDAACSPRT